MDIVKPLVSVIMPVYCIPETLLRDSIESVLNQTYDNLELLIIDDGSPDNCGVVCDEYVFLDQRVKCYHISNIGVSGARNCGIENANGQYILFLDSDDSIESFIIEQMVTVAMENNADCIICSCHHVNEHERTINRNSIIDKLDLKIYSKEEILHELFYMGKPYDEMEITAVWGKLYKRRLLENVIFDKRMYIGEDFALNYEVLKKTVKVVCISTKGYYYLLRSNSAIHGKYNHKYCHTLNGLKDLISKSDKLDRKGIISRVVNIAIVLFLMIPNTKQFQKDQEIFIKFIKCYRKDALFNNNTRLKVKISLILSYFDFQIMKKLYRIFKK